MLSEMSNKTESQVNTSIIDISSTYLKAIISSDRRSVYSNPAIYDAMVYEWLGREYLAESVAGVIKNVSNKENDLVLDIGAGSGVLSISLAKRGLNVTAADYDQNALSALQNKAACIDISISTFAFDFNYPFWPIDNNSFNLVTSLRANRYIQDLDNWLENVSNILVPEGYLILPIFLIDTITWKQHSKKGLFQETSLKGIAQTIKEHGFTIDQNINKEHHSLSNQIPFFYKPDFIIAQKI